MIEKGPERRIENIEEAEVSAYKEKKYREKLERIIKDLEGSHPYSARPFKEKLKIIVGKKNFPEEKEGEGGKKAMKEGEKGEDKEKEERELAEVKKRFIEYIKGKGFYFAENKKDKEGFLRGYNSRDPRDPKSKISYNRSIMSSEGLPNYLNLPASFRGDEFEPTIEGAVNELGISRDTLNQIINKMKKEECGIFEILSFDKKLH